MAATTTSTSTPAAATASTSCTSTPAIDGSNSWQPFVARLAAALAPAGFDVVHPLPVQLLLPRGQDASSSEPAGATGDAAALPTFGRAHSTLAVLVGNSAALWAPFVAHVAAAGGAAAAGSDPLDAYTEARVTAALRQACSSSNTSEQLRHHVRFAHHVAPPSRFFDALQAAHVSGLAFVSPTTHLAWHPEYGPWCALRALVVCDLEGPDPASFHLLPCPDPKLEEEAAQQMKQLEALGGLQNWRQHWREWAALRALGGRHTDPRHAYCAEMLAYHYTKDREVLARAADAAAAAAAAVVCGGHDQQQQQQQIN